jgi:hypothetical protein
MIRVSTILIAALPFVLIVWMGVGMIVPGLGMHDGDG